MTLKMVTDLEHESEILGSSLDRHTPKVSRLLGRKWSHLGKAKKVARHVSATLTLLAQDLSEDRQKMNEADYRHFFELTGDLARRTERDEATAELRRRYIRARDAYAFTYGEDAAIAVGFKAKTARVPRRLSVQADHLLKSLAKTTAPESPDDGLVDWTLGHAKLIAYLEPHHARLEKALTDIMKEKRSAEATLIAKNAAMRRHAEKVKSTANVAEELYLLAGMSEEAARIRPIMRRVRHGDFVVDELEVARAVAGDGVSPPRSPQGDGGPPDIGPPDARRQDARRQDDRDGSAPAPTLPVGQAPPDASAVRDRGSAGKACPTPDASAVRDRPPC